MTVLSRQNSVADTDEQAARVQDPRTLAAASALPVIWPDAAAMLQDILPLADKLDANDNTKHERKQQCRRVVELTGKDETDVTALQQLGTAAIKSYCDQKAADSTDTYAKMACAMLKLIAAGQANQDLPACICREIAALEGMAADCEASRRGGKKTPPSLASFVDPAVKLFDKLSTEHLEMNYAELAQAVWLIFTVLCVATRTRTMRAARWGVNVIKLDNGDWQIKLGDDENPGTKHRFPLNVKLSDLGALGEAGLLRPDMAATALDWLWNRTDGEKHERLVFSRNSKKGSQMGKDVFGKYMKTALGKDMDCGLLRSRLEQDAAAMAQQGTITPADRAMVSSLLQHSGKTAGLDYSGGASAEAPASDSATQMVIEGDDAEQQESSESSADDDNGAADDMEDVANEDDDNRAAEDMEGAANEHEANAVQMDSEDEDSSAIIERLKNRISELEGGQQDNGVNNAAMIKTIVKKWEMQQENVRDPTVDPKVPLNFTRFLDGDDENFMAYNCVELTPYEWFSAPDGRDWCVSWDHYVHADAALTDEEKSFVMDNFDLFAAHFQPRAAEARLLLNQADHDYVHGEIGKLRARIQALEDAAALPKRHRARLGLGTVTYV